jgi:hypothetical protein
MKAHMVSTRSDTDPRSAFLLALQICMWVTFALGLAMFIFVFFIS